MTEQKVQEIGAQSAFYTVYPIRIKSEERFHSGTTLSSPPFV